MPRGQQPELSDREKQLIKLAADGFIDTAIANQLGISEATVSTYWGRIRVKLGPHSRTELVAIVIRQENELVLHALREENDRLARQIRLTSGQYGDHQSANFYQDLIEFAADAMFVVNQEGIIDHLNQAVTDLFGYEKEELIGKPISTLIPERYRMVHNGHRAEYFMEPTKRKMGEHMSTMALNKSGKEFPIAATLSAIQVESTYNVLCIVRAVSSR
jgi:PAS domain S-box-containing protein